MNFLFPSVVRASYRKLTPSHRKAFWWLLGLSVGLGLLEMAVASGISLLGIAMSSAESLNRFPVLLQIQGLLPFSESVSLTLRMLCVILSGVVFITFVKNAYLAFLTWKQNLFSQAVAWDFGVKLFTRYIDAPFVWHSGQNTAELLTVLSWKQDFANFYVSLLYLVTQAVVIVFLLGCALFSSPMMSVFVFVMVSFVAYVVHKLCKKKIYSASENIRKYNLYNSRVSMQALQGLREVIVYGRREAVLEEYVRYISIYSCAAAAQAMLPNVPQWVLEFVGIFLLFIVLVVFLLIGEDVAVATGTLALLAAISWRLLPATNKMLAAALALRRDLPVVEHLLAVSGGDTWGPPAQRTLRAFEATVQLQDISFAYPASKGLSLSHVSLTLHKGKMVGVVGVSGAGKSTLCGIVSGVLYPTDGALMVDGQELDPSQERLRLGYVPQNLYLLDATLAENVAFSRWGEPIDRERVVECCNMAAIDFLQDLPDGIDTALGERGARLSGGQMQRVGIARALYCNPELLIFDEATSALDGAAEEAIQATINVIRGEMTLLVIAHRLSTVRHCDYVYWMENGEVVMEGVAESVLPAYKEHLDARSKEKQSVCISS